MTEFTLPALGETGGKFQTLANLQAETRRAIDAAVSPLSSGVRVVGDWSPAGGAFPTTRPGGAAIQIGDAFVASTAGTVDGVAFGIVDRLVALVAGGGATYSGNWVRVGYSELIDTPLSVSSGGTGATTAAAARAALFGATALAVADGGTGATTAAAARTSLGVGIITHRFVVTDAAYGAVGDGTGNQAAAINACIDAAEAYAATKGGADVVFPDGDVFRTTATLRVAASSVNLVGIGNATIKPVGSFSTIQIESATAQTYLYRNHVSGLILNETGKTGGLALLANYVGQLDVEMVALGGFDGVQIESFNSVDLRARMESFTGGSGAAYCRLIGGRSLGGGLYNDRSDVARIHAETWGGVRSAGMVGLVIDGFVHTVHGQSLYLVNIGGDAFITRNSISAVNVPSFLRFEDYQTDSSTGRGLLLSTGTDIQVSGGHFNRSNTDGGAQIDSAVTDVGLVGCFVTGNDEEGILTNGTGVSIVGCHVYNNSNNEFGGTIGGFPGVLVGTAARDTIISATRSGRSGSSTFQNYGLQIDTGADDFVVTGNNFRDNATGGVNNGAGTGATKIVANNL